MKALVLILFLFTFACSKWRGTRIMYASGHFVLKAVSHINVDTGMVHSFGMVAPMIVHRAYRTNFGKVNIVARSNTVQYLDVTNTKHTAASDGADDQIIALVYDSTRNGQESDECQSGKTNGCKDIFIVESKDDGVTWSAPFRVPRPDSDDVMHRRQPSITYDREVDALHIVFTRFNPITGEMNMGLVTKFMSKGKYNNEHIFELKSDYKFCTHPKISVTNPEKHKGTLHMAYLGTYSNGANSVHYTYSKDNGITWSAPKDMTPHDHINRHHCDIASVGIAGKDEVFMIYNENHGAEMKFTFSRNGGGDWSQPKTINKQKGVMSYMKACGETKTLGVFITLFDETSKTTTQMLYFDNEKETFKEMPIALTDVKLNNIPMGDCTGLNKPMFIIAGGAKTGIVFDDFDYEAPIME